MRSERFRYTEWRDFKSDKVIARELYDHQNDARETVNCIDRPEYAATVASLAQQLRKTSSGVAKDKTVLEHHEIPTK